MSRHDKAPATVATYFFPGKYSNVTPYSARSKSHQYVMAHSQVILDRTGAPDSMLFLAQDYFAHVHSLKEYRQIYKKLEDDARHFPYPDVLLV
jgi:hypothetical protein